MVNSRQDELFELSKAVYALVNRRNVALHCLESAAASLELFSGLLEGDPVKQSGELDRLSGTLLALYVAKSDDAFLRKAGDTMKKSLRLVAGLGNIE